MYTKRRIVRTALFALCDDGSVWEAKGETNKGHQYWERMPDIPQSETNGR